MQAPIKMYISGKITGIEAEAETLFAEAEKFLLKKNFEPLNPMKLPHNHDKSWKSYMKECIIALCKCDGIYMLKNWQDSHGAILEHTIAKGLNMPIMYQDSYQPRPFEPVFGC